MAELTQEMVQRRLDGVASGTFQPEIPGLPGLVFVKLGLSERGKSSRAYSAKLKELFACGEYFSEAMLPTVLGKVCKDNGLDIGVIKKQRELLKRFYESIPADLAGPVDQLTEEEAAQLSPEEKTQRQAVIEERGKKIMEFMQNFYTEEDYRVMDQAKQIENLEQHLKSNTAEHHARKHQMETEILLCARQEDIKKPYFESIEQIQELEDTNRQGLVQLYMKWKQFKEGMLPQFFRSDNPH